MAIELANHIYRDGEGVPVVLMNAYPVDHRMWDVCAKALADFADLNDVPDFPIWAPDMAGSGASPVPSDADSGPRMANGAYSEALDRLAGAYVDLIKAAGYEQAIWVGLSMGGYVAMDIQRLYPELKKKSVVVLDCVGEGDELLILPGKTSHWNDKLLDPILELFSNSEMKTCVLKTVGLVHYPSDNRAFTGGTVICACKKVKGFGRCILPRKTEEIDEENLSLLCDGLCKLVMYYNPQNT